MMNNVLQTNQGNDQNGEWSTPTKQIAKKICKKESNKADVQPKNANR